MHMISRLALLLVLLAPGIDVLASDQDGRTARELAEEFIHAVRAKDASLAQMLVPGRKLDEFDLEFLFGKTDSDQSVRRLVGDNAIQIQIVETKTKEGWRSILVFAKSSSKPELNRSVFTTLDELVIMEDYVMCELQIRDNSYELAPSLCFTETDGW